MSATVIEPPRVSEPERDPGPGHNALTMLELPRAGHLRARRWALTGLLAYVLLSGVIVFSVQRAGRESRDQQARSGAVVDNSATSLWSMIGLGPNRNYAITVLVLSGVALTLGSMHYVRKDIGLLAEEESDIAFVLRTKGRRLDLIFHDDELRDRLADSDEAVPPSRKGKVQTLLDDRVRRVQAAQAGGNVAVSVEEMRNVAERRSAQFGSFPRYASSLLLLLAVLGTFAGVKTALPWLVQAVSNSVADTTALSKPLQAIAEAFGGNALALVGAISVGLMAQGIAFGRQNMLERLELVSSEYVYGNETETSSDPMQAAIRALSRTSSEFQNASGALLGIETGLNELGDQFRSSLDSLGDRLGDIANRQESNLYDKTGATLESLQLRVGELTKSVEANAHSYAGLIASIRDRTEETRAAISSMEKANTQLARGIEGLLGAGQRAQETFTQAHRSFETMESAATRLADDSTLTKSAVESLSGLVGSLKDSADSMAVGVGALSERLEVSDRRTDKAIAQLGAELGAKMETPAVSPQRSISQSVSSSHAAMPDSSAMLGALRQIASGIDELRSAPRPAVWMQLLIPSVAASVCVGLAYGLMRLLR